MAFFFPKAFFHFVFFLFFFFSNFLLLRDFSMPRPTLPTYTLYYLPDGLYILRHGIFGKKYLHVFFFSPLAREIEFVDYYVGKIVLLQFCVARAVK